jgi:hypothetical protein
MKETTMKNLHQEHFEDLIITGDLSVFDFFKDDYEISLKIDGSPSVVFGTESATGKFVVGTKSIFNKIKKKICYTEDDINLHYSHQPKVAEILIACLKYLPRIDRLVQVDFLGFGNTDTFQPNTISYQFPEVITQKIVVSPHTLWHTDDELKNAYVIGSAPFFIDTDDVKFVQPCVDCIRSQLPEIDTSDIQFLTVKGAAGAKKQINALIREGEELTFWNLIDIFGCKKLVNLYLLMIEIKENLMDSMIVSDSPLAFLGDDQVVGEGFVYKNGKMILKLVDRYTFSHKNFTLEKSWS